MTSQKLTLTAEIDLGDRNQLKQLAPVTEILEKAAADIAALGIVAGMTTDDLAPIVGPSVGIFLGGSTEWKEAEMKRWGDFCRARKIHYHVARVNTLRRFGKAAGAFATSSDGSSATRFLNSIPLLKRGVDHARRYYASVRQS